MSVWNVYGGCVAYDTTTIYESKAKDNDSGYLQELHTNIKSHETSVDDIVQWNKGDANEGKNNDKQYYMLLSCRKSARKRVNHTVTK